MKKQDKLTNWHWFIYGCLIIATAIYFRPAPDKIVDEYIALPPCQPWDGGDYWCKSYVDWGYANGLVMAKRVRGDLNFQGRLDEKTDTEIIDELYEIGHKTASGEIPFRTKK